MDQINLFTVPNQFQAQEKLLHFGLEMKLKNKDNHVFGTITEKADHPGKKFVLTSQNGNVNAVARPVVKALQTSETLLDITDASDHKIGSIDHKTTQTAFGLRDRITILDVDSKVIGKTEQLEVFNQCVLVKNQSGMEVGEIKRDKKILGDSWKCRFMETIDPKILVFLPAFISVIQMEKKKKEKS